MNTHANSKPNTSKSNLIAYLQHHTPNSKAYYCNSTLYHNQVLFIPDMKG